MKKKTEIKYKNGLLYRLDWDIEFKGTKYYGYRFHYDFDYIAKQPDECKPAMYNYEEYYICRREVPTNKVTKHLIFASRRNMFARWDFKIQENRYVKNKYGDDDLRSNVILSIFRNDRLFYEDSCGTKEYAVVQALRLIEEYESHVLDLGLIDFDKNMVGRKIYFRDEPAIIDHFMWGNGAIWIIPDKEAGCKTFKCPQHWLDDDSIPCFWGDYEEGLQVPLTSNEINWFRKL